MQLASRSYTPSKRDPFHEAHSSFQERQGVEKEPQGRHRRPPPAADDNHHSGQPRAGHHGRMDGRHRRPQVHRAHRGRGHRIRHRTVRSGIRRRHLQRHRHRLRLRRIRRRGCGRRHHRTWSQGGQQRSVHHHRQGSPPRGNRPSPTFPSNSLSSPFFSPSPCPFWRGRSIPASATWTYR